MKRSHWLVTALFGYAALASSPNPEPSTSPLSTAPGDPAAITAVPQGKCVSDIDVIEDLKRHREELLAKEKELKDREGQLAAQQKALDEEIKKLEAMRTDIAQIQESRKKENEQRVSKIVETLQGMSPKAAAGLLSAMDEALAVSAISRIETPKLSKILNVMDAEKSSRLSEILAGVVRSRSSTNSAQKGGEKS